MNRSTESDAKTARVAAAKTGGFHVTYGNANPWQTRYRRWENGSFIRDVTIKTVFAPNGDIAEAGNGDIHVVWEDWDGTEQIGWAKSTDGGLTFAVRDATAYGNSPDGQAKHPGVAAWGADNGANMMMSSWNADSKQMFYNTLTNAANPAVGNTYTGFNGDNQYAVNGMCRSLQDGTIYRLLSRSIGGVISVVMRRFNGSSWDPEVVVASCGFFARESIAVNPVGQIMTSWEQDNHLFTRLYTPGTGWAAITDMGEAHFGWVTAVPTTNDFYMTYANGAQNNCYGRRWSNGWFPAEDIAIGIPDGFTPDTHCAAGPDGTIYAVWEYWGAGNGQWSDKPQQWFNVLPGVSGSRGTLSGVVIDQYGAGVPGATVASGAFATIAGTNGAYSLNLPTGTQSTSATKQYYTSQTINVSITQNQTTIQNFTIQANPPSPVSAFVVTPS
ncbi:MAG: carboxypeptidase-like regulatory domain-containing protein, partial [Armatimonadota bacterium]